MDFTLEKYEELLSAFQRGKYEFVTFADYVQGKAGKRFIILRHDVDLLPQNSLRTARIEAEMGARGTYYFRAVPESWDEGMMREIAQLGHEVGYHYESLTTCNGDVEAAYKDFCMNLKQLRTLVPVQTICMHGSPRSPYDSKDIWKKDFSYRNLDIIGEPYLDVDFSKVFYLTDTGRRWDGHKVSVRDRIEGWQDEWNRRGWMFHQTDDIIRALGANRMPSQLMLTVHPQRWNAPGVQWTKELILQNVKNVVKRMLIMHREKDEKESRRHNQQI